jgi:hypothetical protein
MLIRAVETIETSEGRCRQGDCVTLPPMEARKFIDAGKATEPTNTIETASFVQPSPHLKRERRYRELNNANRLATNNRTN